MLCRDVVRFVLTRLQLTRRPTPIAPLILWYLDDRELDIGGIIVIVRMLKDGITVHP